MEMDFLLIIFNSQKNKNHKKSPEGDQNRWPLESQAVMKTTPPTSTILTFI